MAGMVELEEVEVQAQISATVEMAATEGTQALEGMVVTVAFLHSEAKKRAKSDASSDRI